MFVLLQMFSKNIFGLFLDRLLGMLLLAMTDSVWLPSGFLHVLGKKYIFFQTSWFFRFIFKFKTIKVYFSWQTFLQLKGFNRMVKRTRKEAK